MHTVKTVILFLLVFEAVIICHGQVKPVVKALPDSVATRIDSLKAAVVIATSRPRLKGDTVEYNVEHFVLPPHAVVEELMKRLPSLQIDADGTITYNGEKVQHLLVDGEDVFGSDPTMVTRTLDASKISRIQILDRKTDDASFTGIDDGTRIKTINLVVKASEKNGYFGKVETGGNTGGNYNANAIMTAFHGREQLSALGLLSNTGVSRLSNNGMGETSQISLFNGAPDPLGASAGPGIPRFDAGALHYANTWNELGNHLAANYQYGHYSTRPISSELTLQTEQGAIYGQDQTEVSVNDQIQHSFFGVYDWATSAKTGFHITMHGVYAHGRNYFSDFSTGTFNDTLVNSGHRTIQDQVDQHQFGGDISWRIKLGVRADRIFSLGVGASSIGVTTEGYLYSLERFYQSGGQLASVDTVDQRKVIVIDSKSIGGNIGYTEPLWKGAVVGINYVLNHSSDGPAQSTYDHYNNKYQQLVDSLNSTIEAFALNQRSTIEIEGKNGKLYYSGGAEWTNFNYMQNNLLDKTSMCLHNSSFTPRARVYYSAGPFTSLDLIYESVSIPPSASQLAPITNNNDPLHVFLGNPDLKFAYSHKLKMDMQRFKNWRINFSVYASVISNSISTRVTTDSLGRQVSQPVNVDGTRNGGINFTLYRNILGTNAGLHLNGLFSRTITYINDDLSKDNMSSTAAGVSLEKVVVNQFSLLLNSNFVYIDQISSINTSVPIHYWVQNHTGSLVVYIIPHFEVGMSANYKWQQKMSMLSTNTSEILWNCYISRTFIKDKVVLRFNVNNILNQNASVGYSSIGNVNTQSASNILGRYWMLSAIYHFDHKFKHAKQ